MLDVRDEEIKDYTSFYEDVVTLIENVVGDAECKPGVTFSMIFPPYYIKFVDEIVDNYKDEEDYLVSSYVTEVAGYEGYIVLEVTLC